VAEPADAQIDPAGEPGTEPAVRVTTLELFFDLVFVFTVTQLTELLAEHVTWATAAEVVVLLAVTVWMYGGYAWLTNAVAPTNRVRRFLLLVGMGGFLTMALAMPEAFGDDGWAFGLGYFLVNAVHTGLFVAFGGPGSGRAMLHLAPANFTSATLVLVGGFLPEPWRWWLWVAAAVVQVLSALLRPVGDFRLSPGHFVERHGLVLIVALGESIVAIGVGARGLDLDLLLILVASLGLTIAYLLWWTYFAGDDNAAERALEAVEPRRRARLAIRAYAYAFYFLLLGIVVLAAGVKKATEYADGHLKPAYALLIAGGLAVFLLGDSAFRRTLGIGTVRFRAGTAVVALATVPLGMVSTILQLASVIVLIIAMLLIELRYERRHAVLPSSGIYGVS
jgi:low temperature requirement protein LtrA